MRKVRLVVSLMSTMGVLGAVAAGSASAAPPELGRCVKVSAEKVRFRKVYHGAYAKHTCTAKAKSANGKYEWSAGPGELTGYESPGALEPAVLETPAGKKVECKNHKVYGEYTSATTETRTIGLYECKELPSGEHCQSIDTGETPPTYSSGTIISEELEGQLGMINSHLKKPLVGWDFKAKSGSELFMFECGPVTIPGTGELTGPGGVTGISGLTLPAGAAPEGPGSTGSTGPTGETGTAGAAAPSSAKGVRGREDAAGATGLTGTTGTTGLPSLPVEYEIEGSVIGDVKPLDVSREELLMSFTALQGEQVPEMFEGGSKATMTATIVSIGASPVSDEAIGLDSPEEEISNEENLEIKAIP